MLTDLKVSSLTSKCVLYRGNPKELNSEGLEMQMTNHPTFHIYSVSSINWYFLFLHFKTFKIQFHGDSPLYIMFRSVKQMFTYETFEAIPLDIPFLYKIC